MAPERDGEPGATVGMATATTPRGHEARDVSVGGVAAVVAALLGLALVIHVALWVQMTALWTARQAEVPPPLPVAGALPEAPPEPRLQAAPRADLAAMRAAEDRLLGSYGWVDRRAGVVRIPVDRAMTLVAEEAAP
jgi:hypothetical protein